MSVFFYSTKLGNAYVVGCGKCEIAKFWFAKGDDSHSPLTEEEAKRIADRLVEFLKISIPSESLTEEEYGDSDKYLKSVKLINRLSESLHSESDEEDEEDEEEDETPSFEDFMKLMFMASMMTD